MRAALAGLIVVLVACGKSADERARDVGVCADTADATRIAACLEGRGWDAAPAESAAAAAATALDSMYRWQLDSTWRVDMASHAADVERCLARRGEVEQCLRLAGWPPPRALATAESLWNTRADEHHRQIDRCVRGSGGGNIADCLMLYYKWTPARALAANDSVQHDRMRR